MYSLRIYISTNELCRIHSIRDELIGKNMWKTNILMQQHHTSSGRGLAGLVKEFF